jgi:alkylation response protein AidB-like acyl-CoA dehydrogenase
VAVVPWLIATLGDEALAGRWLPGLAAGDLIATLALPPWRPYAADADAADLVLLAEGDAVWLAGPGARHGSVDPARSLFEAEGRQLLARGPAVAGAIAQARDVGVLACAAQLLGAGRALLAAGVRHAGQRVQFGRPVGAFQAVKHHLADVAIALEFAGPLLDAAASTVFFPAPALSFSRPRAQLFPPPRFAPTPTRRPPPLGAHPHTAARDVSAAKVACTGAARLAARSTLQVHGAIGYTEEHDLHLWLLKVRSLAGAWGSQAEHRARVMAALTAPGSPPWT